MHRLITGMLALTLIILTVQTAVPAAALPGARLQLVADRESGLPGDVIAYHLLYHNAADAPAAESWLRVILPPEMQPERIEGGDYDPFTRTIIWPVDAVPAGTALSKQFQLQVGEATAVNAPLIVTARLETKHGVQAATPKVPFHVGEAIGEPIFQGYPDGTFRPTALITRAEMAAVLARIKQLPDPAQPPAAYRDVPPEHWAYRYVNRVVAAGYMMGDAQHFHPDLLISRAELVTMLLRIRGVEPFPFPSFGDTARHWASDALGTARALGWVDGTGDGLFMANLPAERQAVAKLFSATLTIYK